MKYLTAKELSEKWNITRCRVVVLAREGRIEGAKLYGKSWVFPENAHKPTDARTRSGKAEKSGKDIFRYPIFEYKDVSSYNPPPTGEELILKNVIEAFNAFRFDDARRFLGDLPEQAQNLYVRLSALYCGCMVSIFLCDTRRFLDYYGKLKVELSQDFPHKPEMIEYLHEIDASIGENDYYSHEFNAMPAYKYHESFLPRLCNLSSVWLTFGDKPVTHQDLISSGIYCSFLEKTDNYFDLQAIYVYMACGYSMLDKKEECYYYFRKALELAEKYDMFFSIASSQYSYKSESLNEVLASFPEDSQNKVQQYNINYRKCLIRFTDAIHKNSLYKLLSGNEYLYIVFAVQKLTNKEIAQRMHISVGTVGKRYSEIYEQLGVESKSEMVKLYHFLTGKGDD